MLLTPASHSALVSPTPANHSALVSMTPASHSMLISLTPADNLKVPKCEIFDRSDFHDFCTIKPFWVDDFGAKI